MTDVTKNTAFVNEDMFEDELKCFSFSEKEKAYICQILVEENQTKKICGAQVKMLMDGKRVKKPTSNMKRHIKKSHGILHHKIVQEQECIRSYFVKKWRFSIFWWTKKTKDT